MYIDTPALIFKINFLKILKTKCVKISIFFPVEKLAAVTKPLASNDI